MSNSKINPNNSIEKETSNTKATSSSNSYNVFTYVDKMVSKPVIGSDGAGKWQEWKKENDYVEKRSLVSTAPHMPVKRNDKLATNMKSIIEERIHENEVRKQAGFQPMGEGYTEFKRTKRPESESKEYKNALKRIRPDNIAYYIASDSFSGWRKDYIFTTREPRGTGYYWDGMDTYRELTSVKEEKEQINETTSNLNQNTERPKKKKRKKEKKQEIPNDNEIMQRQQLVSIQKPKCKWKRVDDALSGKTYYYHIDTHQTTWECPTELKELPPNWNSTMDSASGREYFYNAETGETRWQRPT